LEDDLIVDDDEQGQFKQIRVWRKENRRMIDGDKRHVEGNDRWAIYLLSREVWGGGERHAEM
jgi:hypothetical protein